MCPITGDEADNNPESRHTRTRTRRSATPVKDGVINSRRYASFAVTQLARSSNRARSLSLSRSLFPSRPSHAPLDLALALSPCSLHCLHVCAINHSISNHSLFPSRPSHAPLALALALSPCSLHCLHVCAINHSISNHTTAQQKQQHYAYTTHTDKSSHTQRT